MSNKNNLFLIKFINNVFDKQYKNHFETIINTDNYVNILSDFNDVELKIIKQFITTFEAKKNIGTINYFFDKKFNSQDNDYNVQKYEVYLEHFLILSQLLKENFPLEYGHKINYCTKLFLKV